MELGDNMGIQAMTQITGVTLASGATSITFSGIPQKFNDLKIVINAAMSSPASPAIRFNRDATSGKYFGVNVWGTGSSTGSTYNNTYTQGGFGWWTASPNTNSQFNATIDVLDFSRGDKNKTAIARGSEAAVLVDATIIRWVDGAPITSITITGFNGAGTWAAGSTFNLYGIVA